MLKHMPWEWERLDEVTWRAKVIGGWIVKSEWMDEDGAVSSMVMISDRDHEWKIIVPTVPAEVERSDAAKDFEC